SRLDTALYDAATQSALHRGHPRQTAGHSAWAEEGGGDRRQERVGPAALVKAAGMAESRLPSPCLKLQEVSNDAVGEHAVRKSVGRLQFEPDDRRGARTGEPPDLCVENLQR